MKFIFIDECGNPDVSSSASQSNFLVLSGVCIDSDVYQSAAEKLIAKLKEIDCDVTIGSEVKAKNMISKYYKDLINNVDSDNRAIKCICHMLDFVKENNGVAWSVILDKEAYYKSYPTSQKKPFGLCFNDLFERVQFYLNNNHEYAVCVFDQFKQHDDFYFSRHSKAVNEGSYFACGSRISPEAYTHKASRVIDCYLGNSKNSLGIKVADFVARATFQLLKCRDRKLHEKIVWKDKLIQSFDTDKNGRVCGCGYKFIPSQRRDL